MTHSVRRRLSRVALALAASALCGRAASSAPAAIDLPGPAVFPESLSATQDGTLYVGSVADGGIVRIAPGGKPEQWVAPGASGTRSIFGVLADDRHGLLWACSNDVSALGVRGPSTVAGSFLKAFDLRTGTERHSARLPGEATLCNDIAIGPDGAAYVTNSRAPQILRMAPDADRLEVWKDDSAFTPPSSGAGLDGIAFASDGTLYVDTFNKAELFRVAVADGKAGMVTKLRPSRPLSLADALRPVTGSDAFLLIEGSGSLDRVTFRGDAATIETIKAGLDAPTSVAQVGGIGWVSEGQLPKLFAGKGMQPRLPFHVVPVPLPTP